MEHRILEDAYADFFKVVSADDEENKRKQLLSSRSEHRSIVSRIRRKKSPERRSHDWDLKAKLGRPPTFQDIKQVVEDAEKDWKGKDRLLHGKAQKCFHSFCKTLGAHSTMLQMIPSQNNYTASFCGAISTLVKVRVTDMCST